MAVVHQKSTAITNADATPKVPTNSYLRGGVVRTSVGKVQTGAADDPGSILRFVRVPSNARVVRLNVTSDDAGATGTFDIGVYKTAADGGAVVDADEFAAAYDLKAAALVDAVVTIAPENKEKRLWDHLGLTADPGIDYDIAMTTVEEPAAATDIALEVTWVQ